MTFHHRQLRILVAVSNGFLRVTLGCLAALVFPLNAQPFRLVTVPVDGFAAASPDQPLSEADAIRLGQIADGVRPTEAEVIVLENLPNRHYAERFAALMKPAAYQVALFSMLPERDADELKAEQSITILSKRQPVGARFVEWRIPGQPGLPGGFAFTAIQLGTNTLGFYVAALPGGANEAASRNRELAAQYVAQHVQWFQSTLGGRPASFFVVGNFSDDPESREPDEAARVFHQAGFSAWLPALTTGLQTDGEATACPEFTAMTARNAAALRTPVTFTRRPLARPLVAYDVLPGAKSQLAHSFPTRQPARGQTTLWLWVVGIVIVSAAILGVARMAVVARAQRGIFRRGSAVPVVIDLNDPAATSGQNWQEPAQEPETGRGAGLMEQMRHLFRERLVAWLAAQRKKLLASQHSGAQAMVELEERLGKIQGQFHEQILSRDERIAQLEQEVQMKEQIIRELLRAQAALAEQSPAEQ